MGKLSIKQKAERYDKIIEIAKSKILYPDKHCYVDINEIFPELVKSEDEQIRERLIGYFSDFRLGTFAGIEPKKIIAWLEKQKEFVSADFDDVWETADCNELTAPLEKYSKDAIKEMCHAWYDKGIELERRNWLEKKGGKTPVPKFEVGDVMRTLQEAADNITSGLPVVVSIDNEFYLCNNELIAIKDQDDYEYPPMNSIDHLEAE